MDIEEKFAYCMLKMRAMYPFYGILYSHLPKKELPKDFYMQTMGVTSKCIYYSEDYVNNTPLEELLFDNLHEICHYALLHPSRIGDRNQLLYNIAADMYVNKLLSVELGLDLGKTKVVNGVKIKMSSGSIYDPSVDIMNDTVEDIYDRLRKNSKVSDGGFSLIVSNGTGSSTKYKIKDVVIRTQGSKSIECDYAKGKIIEAMTAASLQGGRGSSRLERIVSEILVPKLDWRKLVRKYLIEETIKETSYDSIDTRMLYRDLILPGMYSKDRSNLDRVKIAIDTSASRSDKELSIFFAQMKQLLDRYKVGAEVIYWDTEIQSKGYFKDMKGFNSIKAKGGGGTNPECVFNYLDSKECKVKPLLTIVSTDGYFNSSSDSIKKFRRKFKDTIWIVNNGTTENIPFGKAVQFEID